MNRSDLLKNVTRIVVKVGTGVLTDSRKQLDLAQMERLVGQLAIHCKAGKQIVLVSSGAVGNNVVLDRRPTRVSTCRAPTPGVRA